ncbi:triphosphoribosyl-dephospho-CoA synthase CitG [Vibrio ziniensis]|uniref:Probable 2-(5''-triphosphoribosyl)-3'-dephosphocoenzyme-A synthase n=1 Tax=Vibrio ziniensis TaxID=2711221 RepID=A0A6G7CIT6_9VIBR|nr:triphosphoribosyl-dephospho-CoA synthase CitG [Vibrio ziniensis]QIH42051.1 triphosphoribosyl-dephospho-CoA synthase CitG [Vibrio ziniensis]
MNTTNSLRWLLDDCCLYQKTEVGTFELNICELVGNLAYHSMMLEVHLTPKPGLVDCLSNGAHSDMNIDTFIASANILRPYMLMFVKSGLEQYLCTPSSILPNLRKIGIEAERAMFSATGGVNTHKGMIFTLGLICGAVGWLYKRESNFESYRIQSVIQECCAHLVEEELHNSNKIPVTAGEKIFRRYGLTGIRGEAAKGYPIIFDCALPTFEQSIYQGLSEEQAMFKTLLTIMACNDDSNLVNRGGLNGLNYVKSYSKSLIQSCQVHDDDFEQRMQDYDKVLIDMNLSPGGSADLLAATWLISQLNLLSR